MAFKEDSLALTLIYIEKIDKIRIPAGYFWTNGTGLIRIWFN